MTANSTQLNLKYCMRIYVKGIQLKVKLSNLATHVLYPPASCRSCRAVKWIVACQNIIIFLCMWMRGCMDEWVGGCNYRYTSGAWMCASQRGFFSQPLPQIEVSPLCKRAEDALHRQRRRAQCARIIKYRRETCYMGIEMGWERGGRMAIRHKKEGEIERGKMGELWCFHWDYVSFTPQRRNWWWMTSKSICVRFHASLILSRGIKIRSYELELSLHFG